MRSSKQAIQTELGFQRRSWTIQRIGWLVIAAWLMANATGTLGPGPCSKGRVADRRWSIEYDRVLHLDAPTRVILLVEREQPGNLELTLAGAYLEAFDVSGLEPAARAESAGSQERRFSLEVHDAGLARIELGLLPRNLGWQTGELRIDDASAVTLRHLVLP
jgi:hypothetical protein